MSQGISEEIIDEIRQRTDLTGLVSEYLKLEKKGKNFVGLCPFHSEKTPSFSVSAEKQLYHCFGCGASGNAFNFIMDLENYSFPEAARLLADRAGVKVPERKASPEDSVKEKIYELNLLAARYYAYLLYNSDQGKKALDYLQRREISRDAGELFMLGYAGKSWTGFHDFALKRGYSPGLMQKAGLVSVGKGNKNFDRFRDRLIFPIFNIGGKVTGFGGRVIDEEGNNGPKYLNSPETPVFDKGASLYGMNLAREEARREKTIILMEGYTDVIISFQAGLKKAVASLGTALTEAQTRLLRSQAETVIIAFDADSAGEAATWRGLNLLQGSGCLVQVADLPPDSDPDSYISRHGAEAFLELLSKAVPYMDYRMAYLKKMHDLNFDRGRVGYTAEVIDLIQSSVNLVEQNYYLRLASEELGVLEEALRAELKKRQQTGGRPYKSAVVDVSSGEEKIYVRPAEKILIALMLQSKEIARQGRNLLEPDFFNEPRIRQIMEAIMNMAENEPLLSAEKLINQFEDRQIRLLISGAVTDPSLQDIEPSKAKRMAEDCIRQLRNFWVERKNRAMQQKLKDLEAQGLSEQINELLRRHQQEIAEKNSDHYRSGLGGDHNG